WAGGAAAPPAHNRGHYYLRTTCSPGASSACRAGKAAAWLRVPRWMAPPPDAAEAVVVAGEAALPGAPSPEPAPWDAAAVARSPRSAAGEAVVAAAGPSSSAAR